MRGLIFGCAKGSAIVFLLIGYGISEPFTQHLINCMGYGNHQLWILVPALDRATNDDLHCYAVDSHNKVLQVQKERGCATK